MVGRFRVAPMRSLCRQAGWTVEELIALVEKYK